MVAKRMNLPKVVVGGWMYSAAKALMQSDASITLAVATVYSGATFEECQIDGVHYFLLPRGRGSAKHLEECWRRVNNMFGPDVVHLHGTESPYGLAFLNCCPEVTAVASIQGLVSCIAPYYLAGLSTWDVLSTITPRDIIRGTLWREQRRFERSGEYEREIIRRLHHIIGRTSWDRAHALAINPRIIYHHCNETLRDVFYTKVWSYDYCHPHTIFVSQAGYPIKGVHQLLKAMPLILAQYPDARIYVAGGDVTKSSDLKSRLTISGYGNYLRRLIRRYGLRDKVEFVGVLTEEQMCSRYLRSNVFVCPSAIENSPNSLGEAQLLGVPCVASYVGGVADMMTGDEQSLYRYEEVEMLASKICDVFALSRTPNLAGRQRALCRHDAVANAQRLAAIYKLLLD